MSGLSSPTRNKAEASHSIDDSSETTTAIPSRSPVPATTYALEINLRVAEPATQPRYR